MSISEQQYYEAKVFLTHLADAHRVLDQGAKQKANISKLKNYQSSLLYATLNGQVKITDGHLVKGKGFESNRLKEIYAFSNNFFSQNMTKFSSAKNAQELSAILKNAAK